MKIVINGAGEIGSHIARLLREAGNEITVTDNDSARLSALSATTDVNAVSGEPASVDTLKEAGIAKADLFIGVTPFVPQEVNITAAVFAKQLGAKKVVARIQDPHLLSSENRQMIRNLGIELTFCPEKIAADEIIDFIRYNEEEDTMDFANGKLHLAAFKLEEESPILDKSLLDFANSLTKEEASAFRIIAIGREKETIIPSADTIFRFGDTVYTVSTKSGYSKLMEELNVRDTDIDSVMIMGGGSVGAMAAVKLSRTVKSVKIVEKSHERCIELAETMPRNVMIVNGDGRDSDLLFEEGIKDYDAFVAVTSNDETNMLACAIAKRYGVSRTIAEVENMEYMKLAEDMGVDNVVNKKLSTAGRIIKFTLEGRARYVKYMSGTRAEVLEYTVPDGAAITRKCLKDIKFPPNAVIGGIVRGADAFIAVGDTMIESGDMVAVFALPESIKNLDKLFK